MIFNVHILTECCQNDKGHNGQEIWSFLACSSRRGLWFWDHTWGQESSVHVLWWQHGYLLVEVLMIVSTVHAAMLWSASAAHWDLFIQTYLELS